MNPAICNLLSCLTISSGLGNNIIRTSDSLIYTNNKFAVACTKLKQDYNCKPTNNFYNPIDN